MRTGPEAGGLSPTYPVRTPRLLLRPWRMDELDTYHRLRGDPEVVRYLYEQPLSRDEAESRLAALRSELTEPGQWINLAVEAVATGEVVGDVGLGWTSGPHRLADIGYTFFDVHRGHGYATEAAAAVVALAFTDLEVHRVAGHLDARNSASAAVLQRLGMRREAHFVENEWVKGEWTDEVVYGILASEWRERRTSR